ncbi:low affinity iron permease family protein [Sphingomonas echinoides]|uniref:Low affinity iron permease family protein n=1 Tax=Sphingomonas echinoides TaxID=59803 RepID=A0ABU4PR12_9SPHN|nr:low affinity iron permease family protein [Sphingomonas echinoides]MDX5986581.1 low affinity iron permease family protein [Sphingomonas echinoides]
MLNSAFTSVAARVAGFAGKPLAFVTASLLIILWLVTGPVFHYSDTWQLVVNTATTVVTFLMVFLIQNSQNRDAAAMQAKLDEVIRASRTARNQFVGIEHRTDQEIERIRAELERECDVAAGPVDAATSVVHLRRRR